MCSSAGCLPRERCLSATPFPIPRCHHVPVSRWSHGCSWQGSPRCHLLASSTPSERCCWETCTRAGPGWCSAHLRYNKPKCRPDWLHSLKKEETWLLFPAASGWHCSVWAGPWGCADRGHRLPGGRRPGQGGLSPTSQPVRTQSAIWSSMKSNSSFSGCWLPRNGGQQTKRAKMSSLFLMCSQWQTIDGFQRGIENIQWCIPYSSEVPCSPKIWIWFFCFSVGSQSIGYNNCLRSATMGEYGNTQRKKKRNYLTSLQGCAGVIHSQAQKNVSRFLFLYYS